MALKPEFGVMSGLAVAAIVYAIHSNATPSNADIQALPAGNADIDASERRATWTSAGIVSAISLIAKDPTIFVIGSAATVGMALMTRQANWGESKSGGGPGTYQSPSEAAQAPGETTGVVQTATEPYTMFDSSSEFDR